MPPIPNRFQVTIPSPRADGRDSNQVKVLIVLKMSIVIKCPKCSIANDEMLYLIQNKFTVIPAESLVKICVDAYSKAEIIKSKHLLFESYPGEHDFTRDDEIDVRRHLKDIIDVFKMMKPERLPVFYATDVNRLTVITVKNVIPLERELRTDVNRLKNEMEKINKTYVKRAQLDSCKVRLLKEVNKMINAKIAEQMRQKAQKGQQKPTETRRGRCQYKYKGFIAANGNTLRNITK